VSANSPCPRTGHSRVGDHGQSVSASRKRRDGSVDRQPSRTRRRRGQSARSVTPRPGRGHALSVSTNVPWLRSVRVRKLDLSANEPRVDRLKPNRIAPMSSFDPASVHQRSRNSHRAVRSASRNCTRRGKVIAGLLTQHGLPISRTAVARVLPPRARGDRLSPQASGL